MDPDASVSAVFTASLVLATPVSVAFISVMAVSFSLVESALDPNAL
jgi:hypothetical protein